MPSCPHRAGLLRLASGGSRSFCASAPLGTGSEGAAVLAWRYPCLLLLMAGRKGTPWRKLSRRFRTLPAESGRTPRRKAPAMIGRKAPGASSMEGCHPPWRDGTQGCGLGWRSRPGASHPTSPHSSQAWRIASRTRQAPPARGARQQARGACWCWAVVSGGLGEADSDDPLASRQL